MGRHHHLQRHRGRRQHPERQIPRVQHPVLEIGQKRLPAVLVIQPDRHKPAAQQLGQPMLLRPKKPQQHIIKKRLAPSPHRLQERHRQQPQPHKDRQPLHHQPPDRRASRSRRPSRELVMRRLGRPAGDLVVHSATPSGARRRRRSASNSGDRSRDPRRCRPARRTRCGPRALDATS
jgi:hypothetical protein